ncbi:MAG: EF-P beta-lysylation protein EpmB [Gammaproteobacteria bacterium]|nr:EF-P beta-lysylation protein EpmB [Gammaproteobacteria bacterium]
MAPTPQLAALAPASASPWPAGAWRRELACAVTEVKELLDLVALSREQVDAAQETGFALRVPRPYIARMGRGDPHDPLLRQVLPTARESEGVSGYGVDPLRESSAVVDSGLLHKYAGRVLLIAAGTCAVNCRYCFRRHFPYAEHRQGSDFPALEAVRRDAAIKEVILSGGDPLMLRDSHFATLVRRVADIDHVRRIRIHTRLPVVIPQRVTAALIDVLASLPKQVVIVLHFNHGNEIDGDCVRTLAALGRFTLLNQSVLLRGVNDAADVLVELSERLFAAGVLPYYLHMPDAVAGTAHFDVSEAEAKALHRRMAARLPGYLTPKLVRETPGLDAKEEVALDRF